MKFAKRIFLFLLVNILVVTTITIVMNVLGVGNYVSQYGLDYGQLAIFCLLWGFGGAFISLGLSRIMAKFMMGVKVIDPEQAGTQERALLQMVYSLSAKAGLTKMPQVGIYESPEVNAFATGPTKNRALVAVSTGLLNRMDGDAIEGVLGHEVAHIANGDMVTMTLIQGVVNAFVMFFARAIAWALSQTVREENRAMVNFIAVLVLQILLSFLGMFVVATFSRWREYRADKGSAMIAGKDKMVRALRALQRSTQVVEEDRSAVATLKISGKNGGLFALLSTHPPLEDRIRALESAN